MITKKLINYILYIEGIQIPAESIQMVNTCDQGCTLTASIPPSPEAYGLKRGMIVHLFKRVDNKDGVLRFAGILINKVYGKTGESRELRIECATPDVRLGAIRYSEINPANMGSATLTQAKLDFMHVMSKTTVTFYGDPLDFLSSIEKLKEGELGEVEKKHYGAALSFIDAQPDAKKRKDLVENISKIRENSSFNDSFSDVKDAYKKYIVAQNGAKGKRSNEKQAEAQAVINAAKNKLDSEYEKLKKEAKEKSIKLTDSVEDFGASMSFMEAYEVNNSAATTKDIVDNSPEKLLGKSFANIHNIGLGEATAQLNTPVKNITGDTAGTGTKVTVTPGTQSAINEELQRQITKMNLSGRFIKKANERNDDLLQAIVDIINEIYDLNKDPVIVHEKNFFKLEECYYKFTSISSEDFVEATKLDPNKKTAGMRSVVRVLKEKLDQMMRNSSAFVPLLQIVQQLLQGIFCRFSVINTQTEKNIVLHPDMCTYFPPVRNVVFPNQVTGITYNGNDWATPTRTYLIYNPYIYTGVVEDVTQSKNEIVQPIAIAPKESRQLKQLNNTILVQDFKAYQEQLGTGSEKTDVIMNNYELRQKALELQQKCSTDEENEIGRTFNVCSFDEGYQMCLTGSTQEKMADWMHGKAKYGTRICSINGRDDLDTLLVGMPILVVDNVYSIYGIVESIVTSVMGRGNIQITVNITLPRMPLQNPYDVINESGLWLQGSKSRPDTIHEAYEEMLGEESGAENLLRKCAEFGDKLVDNPEDIMKKDYDNTDTLALQACIAILNNRYLAEEDKEEFVTSFKGEEPTLEKKIIEKLNGRQDDLSNNRYKYVTAYKESLNLKEGVNFVVPSDCYLSSKVGNISFTLSEAKETKGFNLTSAVSLTEESKDIKQEINEAEKELKEAENELEADEKRRDILAKTLEQNLEKKKDIEQRIKALKEDKLEAFEKYKKPPKMYDEASNQYIEVESSERLYQKYTKICDSIDVEEATLKSLEMNMSGQLKELETLNKKLYNAPEKIRTIQNATDAKIKDLSPKVEALKTKLDETLKSVDTIQEI